MRDFYSIVPCFLNLRRDGVVHSLSESRISNPGRWVRAFAPFFYVNDPHPSAPAFRTPVQGLFAPSSVIAARFSGEGKRRARGDLWFHPRVPVFPRETSMRVLLRADWCRLPRHRPRPRIPLFPELPASMFAFSVFYSLGLDRSPKTLIPAPIPFLHPSETSSKKKRKEKVL